MNCGSAHGTSANLGSRISTVKYSAVLPTFSQPLAPGPVFIMDGTNGYELWKTLILELIGTVGQISTAITDFRTTAVGRSLFRRQRRIQRIRHCGRRWNRPRDTVMVKDIRRNWSSSPAYLTAVGSTSISQANDSFQ